jgi:hypothetical protein
MAVEPVTSNAVPEGPLKAKINTEAGALLVLAACFFIAGLSAPPAQAQSLSEYQVKAAFIYNFAKFIDWPGTTPQGDFVIGILGDDPFRGALQATVKDRSIDGRPVVVRQVSSAEAARNFQILFVSPSERERLPGILDSLKGSAVLTVGETEGFASSGVVINFIVEDSRVRFEVNVDAAERANLRISSKLLSLARIVKDQRHGG